MSSVTVNMEFIDLRNAQSALVLGRHVDNHGGPAHVGQADFFPVS